MALPVRKKTASFTGTSSTSSEASSFNISSYTLHSKTGKTYHGGDDALAAAADPRRGEPHVHIHHLSQRLADVSMCDTTHIAHRLGANTRKLTFHVGRTCGTTKTHKSYSAAADPRCGEPHVHIHHLPQRLADVSMCDTTHIAHTLGANTRNVAHTPVLCDRIPLPYKARTCVNYKPM